MTIDITKITPEKLAEMNDTLMVDNTHLRDTVANLRKQVAIARENLHKLSCLGNGDQLRAELVNALAACKIKDEALQELDQLIPVGATIAALAIQPDDAALKAWLGEPVSYLYKHASAFGYGEFWSHRQNHNGVTAIESKALYSPKVLK